MTHREQGKMTGLKYRGTNERQVQGISGNEGKEAKLKTIETRQTFQSKTGTTKDRERRQLDRQTHTGLPWPTQAITNTPSCQKTTR